MDRAPRHGAGGSARPQSWTRPTSLLRPDGPAGAQRENVRGARRGYFVWKPKPTPRLPGPADRSHGSRREVELLRTGSDTVTRPGRSGEVRVQVPPGVNNHASPSWSREPSTTSLAARGGVTSPSHGTTTSTEAGQPFDEPRGGRLCPVVLRVRHLVHLVPRVAHDVRPTARSGDTSPTHRESRVRVPSAVREDGGSSAGESTCMKRTFTRLGPVGRPRTPRGARRGYFTPPSQGGSSRARLVDHGPAGDQRTSWRWTELLRGERGWTKALGGFNASVTLRPPGPTRALCLPRRRSGLLRHQGETPLQPD